MPTTTTHAPGTFSWPELMTTDSAKAVAFYKALFGWTTRETPMGERGTYYVFLKGDQAVGAGMTMWPHMLEQGVPPHWGSYVTVTDVEASARRVTELGGTVMSPPFDVKPGSELLGRMAVVQDTIGATFCLWQPFAHVGIGVYGEPGSLGWTQLNASNPEKVKPFYVGLFDWAAQDDPNPMGGTYTTWMKHDGPAGGMMAMPPGVNAPSHWLVYWATEDVAATTKKAESLGAKTMMPAMPIPGMGHFSVMADPTGAVFALVSFGTA